MVSARRLPVRLLACCAGLAVAAAAWSQTSPVTRWTFDEALAGQALDAAAGLQDDISGHSRRVAGVVGSAQVFDGYTTVLVRRAGDAPRLDEGFTIAAWIAVAAYPWNSVPLVSHGDGGLRGFSFELGPRGALEFSAAVDGRRLSAVTADFAVPLRQWRHVAARFDPDDGLAVFVDGARAASAALPGRMSEFGRVPSRRVQSAAGLELVVGAVRAPRRAASYHRRAGTRPSWYSLDGLLDEVELYDAALSPAALAAAAAAHRPGAPVLAERRLPSGPPGPARFGAYPTKLAYYPEWDAQWQVGPHPDLLLRFDTSPARVVFWRGTQYSPAWVSGNGLWMADQSVEGYDDDYTWEHMNDKQNRYSHVRVIEQHDARVVVHWRYAPVNVNDELMNVDERSANGAWIDEYYTFHPDAMGVRNVTWQRGTLGAPVQFQESIPLAHPGQAQGEVVHDEYVTIGNLAGQTQVLAYVDEPGESSRPMPADLTIQMHNLRSRQKPFIVFEPGNRMTYLRDLDAASLARPGSSSHWPVGLVRSDGRTAQALDRATSFLGFPISEPVLHTGGDGRDSWRALYGMTERPFADLVMLARSWSRPPEVIVAGGAFRFDGFDRAERCFRLERVGDADALDLRLLASEASPLVNVPLVIEDWGDDGAVLELDGRAVEPGADFRYGHRHRVDGTDLVAWIAHEATRETRVVLRRGAAGGKTSPAVVQPDLNAFLDEIFERNVAQSPIRQSTLGRRTGRLGEWDDFSDAFAARQVEETRRDLARLRATFDYERLSPPERLSYDLFVFDAERDIRDHAYRRHAYVVDQFNGQLSGLITVLQNNHPVASVGDAEDYLSRIRGLEAVLEEFSRQLEDRAAFGVVAPAFSFPDVLTDARRIASGAPLDEGPGQNVVFADFRAKVEALELAAAQTDELLGRARAALNGPFSDGFARLIATLESLRPRAAGNRGVWSLPDGDAYYNNRIRHHTALELSADEIHDIGLAEVARLHGEMEGIMAAVGFDGTLREFFDFIRSDPNNYYENSDAGRERFLADARQQVEDIYAIVGDWFHTLPEARLDVRRVEPWRENSTSIAFYNRPSEDGSRPGIYYANLANMDSVQKYVFTAITYHESVPGHHFQIALAQELDGLPSFRRFSGYGAFTEGWALYAEQLAKEMGFYADPYHDFGRLQNELWRAARLVLDTGIHRMRWTREQAIDYFRENTPLSEGDIVTEVERFFVNPGQALGYKLGMMKILELRRHAQAELGDAFDIRDFHHAVIGAGPLPLPLLEREVRRYVSGEKSP